MADAGAKRPFNSGLATILALARLPAGSPRTSNDGVSAIRTFVLLAALVAYAPAFAQHQYGDPYSGSLETIKMHQDQNRISTYRNDFSTPSFRVEQQIWRPTAPSYSASSSYSTPSGAPTPGSLTGNLLPEPLLVPFGGSAARPTGPRDGYAISQQILASTRFVPVTPSGPSGTQEMWKLYLAQDGSADPARAVALARPGAEAGAPEAMLLLAMANLQGRGLLANEKLAFDWMSRAASGNHVVAQMLLGEMYLNGIGIARSESMALSWLQKAADAGEPRAAFEVGMILTTSRPGVPADVVRAAADFERAARAGDAMGQYLYALCLQTGTGVTRNPAGAIAWLQKASDQGLAAARLRLGQAYYFAEGVPADYGRAREQFELATATEPGAFNALGIYYSDGKAVPQDHVRAGEYFRKGAEQGDREAQFNLASAYFMGEGVAHDEAEAKRWLTRAADAGDPMAQYMAGLESIIGFDVVQAVKRLQQAAAGGFVPALDKLCDLSLRERGVVSLSSAEFTPTVQAGIAENQPACLYVQANRLTYGILGPRDPEQALSLLERAAEGGYHEAELEFGRGLLDLVGQGEPGQDAELQALAEFWLTRAARHGNREADELLRRLGGR